jgi:transposase-like protein
LLSTADALSGPWSPLVATAYLLRVSTRRVERVIEQLGVKAFVRVDALTDKVREDGRVVNVHALVATGVKR